MSHATTSAHIITHTHWDREWFLTSIYTSRWIPGLIDRLDRLVQDNPDFRFLLDGQTLVIEDLLHVAPDYQDTVRRLVQNGNLIIGPYYCQPDWQLADGESLVRNLMFGARDIQRLGGEYPHTGWLVDTFGHIAQAPQLHRLFGIDSVFVWRGVPRLEPYFDWVGSDGQSLLTIDLFGGYRNLYGVTHVPEIARRRLQAEIEKLQPYYPTPDIPLFDGYDLEDNPEDPVRFFEQQGVPADLELIAAVPQQFADTVRRIMPERPHISGELNSGKYGATFPGTLSARAYLKIMARDCAHLLYRVCEPLAVLARLKGRPYAADRYEAWARLLLQNDVHDCLCGVSIDQVHEKMEVVYRRVFDQAGADVTESLAYILHDFAPGSYAVSTNPFPYEGWHVGDGTCCHVQTDGIGVWRVVETLPATAPNTSADGFQWHNDHYQAALAADGSVQIGEAVFGRLIVSGEAGDTYSDEPGCILGTCQITGLPVIEAQSAAHTVVRYACQFTGDGITVSAIVRLTFDRSPLILWQVDLDSQGTNFRVEMAFEAGQSGTIHAGMPFDMVQRPVADRDLMPRDLAPALSKVLLGQREIGEVCTFPFHDLLALVDSTFTTAIFARGLHAYRANDDGRILLTLRRAVEWLTGPDLPHRVGDAGPFFYVPDARCERQVRHELAVAVGVSDAITLQRLNAGFQNPPLIVEVCAAGTQTAWPFLRESLPLSSLQVVDDRILARFWNPTDEPVALGREFQQTDVWGRPAAAIRTVAPKTIVTLALDHALPAENPDSDRAPVTITTGPSWRVGENHGLPDRAILTELGERATYLEAQVTQIENQLGQVTGGARYRLEHRYYVLKREWYEYLLSLRLNELKLAAGGKLDETALFEPDLQVAEIGFQLNQLRIKRRIYDYIVESL